MLGSPTQLCPSPACYRPSTRTASPAVLLELNPFKKRHTLPSASHLWDRGEEERGVAAATMAAWDEDPVGVLRRETRAKDRDSHASHAHWRPHPCSAAQV